MIVKQEGEVGGGGGGEESKRRLKGNRLIKISHLHLCKYLSGREGRRCEKKEKKKRREKEERGNRKTSQYLRRERIPKQLNHTQKHWEQEELHSNSTTLCRLTKLDQKEFSSFFFILYSSYLPFTLQG